MNPEAIVFIVFAIAAVAGAGVMVLARNPVHSALGLLMTMFSVAVFYVMNDAHFVAVVQVLIYAGAVMTLFLFVIMLIGVDQEEVGRSRRNMTLGWIAGLVVFGLITAAAISQWVTAPPLGDGLPGTIENVSDQLFGTWMLAFESTVLLLTIAAVGTISLGQFIYRTRAGEDIEADIPLSRVMFDESRYELETGSGTGGGDA
jgi:NADH-quinone oxidoreductase subunit J